MFCKNCGAQLADNAKFCASCGTPTAPAPGEEPVSDPINFPGAGFPGDEAPAADPVVFTDPVDTGFTPPAAEPVDTGFVPTEAAPTDSASTAEPGFTPPAADGGVKSVIKRRGKAGLAVLGGIGVAAILVVVLLVKLISGLLGGGSSKAVFAYRNDDGDLMYLSDLKEKTQAVKMTSKGGYSSEVRFSSDGKTVYYTDEDSALYRITTADMKKDDKGERVARDVSHFIVLKDGRLAYIQRDGGNKLSIYEKGESYRLAKDFSDYRFSEDQKTLYYTERDNSDNTVALYRVAVTKDAKEERLLKGASTIYTDYDASVLVYGVSDSGSPSDGSKGNNNLTVYSCAPGGDKTKLVGDISSVSGVKVDGSKVSFYYYVEEVKNKTLYDFVNDSKASSDASILSGERPVKPSWRDYFYSYGIDREMGVGYYTDRQDNRYTFDISSLLTDGKTVNDLSYWNVRDLAEAEAHKRYDPANEEYEAKINAWNEAQSRDYIRQNLKEYDYNQRYLNLYRYTGDGKGDAIGTEIASGSRAGNAANGVFLYHKANVAGGKVADVSDLEYAYQVAEKLESGEGDDDWYQNVGGKESVIKDLDEVVSVNGVVVLGGKEVVLNVYDGKENSLRAYSMGKDELTFTSTIIEGNDFTGPYLNADKDAFYLFTEVDSKGNGTVGDFCVYKNGKLDTIIKEIYGAIILDKSGATYAATDFDSRGRAEFGLVKDGKTTTITDEMSGDFAFVDGTQILYLSSGDLMLWNGKENRTVARDVEEFWTSTSEKYSTYSPY